MADETKSGELKVEVDELTAQGVYVNLAVISHSESEFVVDFIFVQPGKRPSKVRSRIISSPAHIKRLAMALEDNIKRFEEKFGPIKVSPPVSRPPTIETKH